MRVHVLTTVQCLLINGRINNFFLKKNFQKNLLKLFVADGRVRITITGHMGIARSVPVVDEHFDYRCYRLGGGLTVLFIIIYILVSTNSTGIANNIRRFENQARLAMEIARQPKCAVDIK